MINKQDIYDEELNSKSDEELVKYNGHRLTKSDLSIFNEFHYGLNIDDSVVYMAGDIIGDVTLISFIAKVRLILKYRPETCKDMPITVILNSGGGDVYEMLGIFDYINSLPVKVNFMARGKAMSAAAIMLVCTTGKRVVSKNTTLMFHEPSGDVSGRSSEIISNATQIESLDNLIISMLTERSDTTKEFWMSKLRKEYYITADEALKLKLIDEIA